MGREVHEKGEINKLKFNLFIKLLTTKTSRLKGASQMDHGCSTYLVLIKRESNINLNLFKM